MSESVNVQRTFAHSHKAGLTVEATDSARWARLVERLADLGAVETFTNDDGTDGVVVTW